MAPELTKPAPEFEGVAVINGAFKDIKLSDYNGKYLVLFFYPLDFTFVCPTEIIAFSDRVEEFKKINCEVVACSTDSHFSHLAWINTSRKEGGLGKMNIPLLADKSCKISKAYGVYKEDAGITFRGLFIIDDKQNLRQITMNDLPVGRSVDETLRLVQAFQFTDKHGEGNKRLIQLNDYSANKVRSIKRQNCDELVATVEAKKRDCSEEKNILLTLAYLHFLGVLFFSILIYVMSLLQL